MQFKTSVSPHLTAILRAGGVITYPTEGVYGLGCLPERTDALRRIIEIKGRQAEKGLILIASTPQQLLRWIDLSDVGGMPRLTQAMRDFDVARACTFVVPAASSCHPLLTGGRDTVAVRVTKFAPAAALCDSVDSALVSTSANFSGLPAITRPYLLRRHLAPMVDAMMMRAPGKQQGVSRIVDLVSGQILRD